MSGEGADKPTCPIGVLLKGAGEEEAEVIRMVLIDPQAHNHEAAALGLSLLGSLMVSAPHVRRHRNSKCSCTEESK